MGKASRSKGRRAENEFVPHACSEMVPVEPDHDSAIIALLSPATVKTIGVSMSYNQAKKIVQVVLVGAGIGDTDG